MDEKVEGLLTRLPEVESRVHKPDIILIMSGMNNVVEHDYTFVNELRRIVIRLTNRFPETEIIVNTQQPCIVYEASFQTSVIYPKKEANSPMRLIHA